MLARASVTLAIVTGCGSGPAAAPGIAAVEPPPPVERPDYDCPLGWEELAAIAPPEIPLRPWPSPSLPDHCPAGFDPPALLAPGACVLPDCQDGRLGRGQRVALHIDGPAGSGRFVSLGLAVAGPVPRFACLFASTVGWRHVHRVSRIMGTLPWLADVGGDADLELVTWQRLPWGNSEADNGLVPAVYVLDGPRLVRRDGVGAAVAARAAAAYRALVAIAEPDDPVECYGAVADALEHWDQHP
jgi:hypothetical protein